MNAKPRHAAAQLLRGTDSCQACPTHGFTAAATGSALAGTRRVFFKNGASAERKCCARPARMPEIKDQVCAEKDVF